MAKPQHLVLEDRGGINPLTLKPADDPLKPNKGKYKMSQGPTELGLRSWKALLDAF